MLIAELKKELIVKGIPSKWYSINDFIVEDGYNFREIHNAYWEIFYMDEKGNQKIIDNLTMKQMHVSIY